MLADRWITDRVPTERFKDYTRGNAGDVLADPCSPLGWTFCWESAIVLGCRDGFVNMGVFDNDEYGDPPEAFGSFGGYLYNSLSQARLFGERSGAGWEVVDRAYFDAVEGVPAFIPQPWHQSPRNSEKLAKSMAWIMATPTMPDVDAQKIEAKACRDSRPELSAMTNEQLIARARTMQRHLRAMFEQHVWASLGAAIGPAILQGVTAELGEPEAAMRLLSGIGDVDSADIASGIWALSRIVRGAATLMSRFDAGSAALFDEVRASDDESAKKFIAALDQFTYEHGARGPNEWDLYADTYETKPELVLVLVERLRHSGEQQAPGAHHDAAAAARTRLAAEIEGKLAGDPGALGTFQAAMSSARTFFVGRERCKTNNIRVIGEMRLCFLELGSRMVAAGHLAHVRQICMLIEDELDAFVASPGSFNSTIEQRERDYLALYELEPPFIVDRSVPPLSQWTRKADIRVDPVRAGDVLKGVPGAPGEATGRARIVLDPADPEGLEPGDILVAPHTDPAWTPLFLTAGGVIANMGAIGTHAVIVSRELGIPCVPSVVDATLRIPEGAIVTVDGSSGTVRVLSVP